jgi:N-acetylmuramoyl-L-alanine amidase
MRPPPIHVDHLSYVDRLDRRDPECIDLVVIHCTELPDIKTARSFGQRVLYQPSGTGNSGHFYIERSGAIQEWVPVNRAAHHVRGYNEHSIGIELDNVGRYPQWLDSRRQKMTQAYRPVQLEALVKLLVYLVDNLPNLQWITGHDMIDTSEVPASDCPEIRVRRKMDPGPMFPWSDLLERLPLSLYES